METDGQNIIGIMNGKRETRIGIVVIATIAMNETTDVQGVDMERRETLPKILNLEIGVGHLWIPMLVIKDIMPHCIQTPSL